MNIDRCFVPTTRTADQAIPAVSGSSGRLIVAKLPSARTAPFPGEVFAAPDQDYADQMHAYATAAKHRHAWRTKAPPPPDPLRQQRTDLRHEARLLQLARRTTRLQREQDDRAWNHLTDERRATVERIRREQLTDERPVSLERPRQERLRERAAQKAAEQHWQALREQRRQTVAQRQRDDQAWRAERNRLRSALTATVVTTAWHAILIITDNCTRQCYDLPLLVDGPNVTSDQVVAALRQQLPESIAFVVSDRGVHFTAHSFQAYAQQQGFVQCRSADAGRKRMGLRSGWCGRSRNGCVSKPGRRQQTSTRCSTTLLATITIAHTRGSPCQDSHRTSMPNASSTPDEQCKGWLTITG